MNAELHNLRQVRPHSLFTIKWETFINRHQIRQSVCLVILFMVLLES